MGEPEATPSRLVGRDGEVVVLDAAIDAAARGAGGLVFLTGEAGTGKSRLLRRMAEEGRRRSATILFSTASAIRRPPGFGVLAQALRGWTREGHPQPDGLRPFAAGLRRVLPEWWADDAPALNEDQTRLLAMEGALQLLRALPPPVLVLLDDLHNADAESLEFVHYAAPALASTPVLLACSIRSAENRNLDGLALDLCRQGLARSVSVGSLGSEDVSQLIEHVMGATPPAALVDEVARRSGGVPLFVEELVAQVQATGSPGVAPSLLRLADARLDRLDEPTRRVCAAAAICDRFDSPTLATLTDGDEAAIPTALAAAVAAGLLVQRNGQIAFRHELLRDAVEAGLLERVRIDLHRRAAESLRRDGDAALAERARHLWLAGDTNAAAELFVAAAQHALKEHSPASAERLATEAVVIAGEGDAAGSAADVLAGVYASIGRWDDALRLDRAARERDAEPNPTRLLRMAETALLAGYHDEAAEVLDAALTAGAPLGRCRPVQALLALRRGNYTVALTFGREALELAQAGESTDQIFRAYDVIVQCLNVLGRRADAVAASETWVARARCDGGVGALVHALVSLGGARLVADEPIDALWEARDLARDAGLFIELAWVNLNLAWAVWWRRPIAEAVALVDDAVRNARELRIDVLPYLLAVQGLIYESRRRGSGRQMVEESRRGFPSDPNRELILLAVDGALAELRGAYEEALGLYRRCVVLMRATPGSTPTGSPSEVPLMLLALGQNEEARGALADAAAWPGQALLNTARPFMRLATAALENRPEDVLPALAPIAENYPFERAIKLMIAAHLFPAADARVDWLQDALRTFEQGGWEAAAEVRRTLRAAGVRVASGPRRRAGLPDALAERGVTEREATVISLVVAGQSNRKIAAALFLSVRTVESHVSSLMRKFGVSTRAELMARARDV